MNPEHLEDVVLKKGKKNQPVSKKKKVAGPKDKEQALKKRTTKRSLMARGKGWEMARSPKEIAEATGPYSF